MKHNTIIFGALATLAIGMFGCDSESQKLEGAMRARYLACEEPIWGEKGEFDFKTERCRCREVLCKYNETCNVNGICEYIEPECYDGTTKCEKVRENDGIEYWTQMTCRNRMWVDPEKCKTQCNGKTACANGEILDSYCEEDGCYAGQEYNCENHTRVYGRKCVQGCEGNRCKAMCEGKEKKCNDEGNVEQCNDGEFSVIDICGILGCTDGECNEQSCDDGAKRCQNNTLQECKDGSWGAVDVLKSCDCVPSDEPLCNPDTHKMRKCENYHWQDTGEECCVDGKTRCSGNAIETCQDNQWTQSTKCQDYYVCKELEDLKHACVCQPGCYKKDGKNVAVNCNVNGKSDDVTCEGKCTHNDNNYVCEDDNGPQPVCAPDGEFQCKGNEIQICEDGEWQTTQTCSRECSMSNDKYPKPYCSCGQIDNTLKLSCSDVTFCYKVQEYSLKECLSKDNVDFCNSSETSLEIEVYCLEYMKELGCFEVLDASNKTITYKWCFYDEKLHYCANGYDDTRKQCKQSQKVKCQNSELCIGKIDKNSKDCYKNHSCISNYTECGKCKNGTYEIGKNHKICIEGEKFDCQLDTTTDSNNYLCNNDNLIKILEKEGVLERYLNKTFTLSTGSPPMNFIRDKNGNYYLVTIDYSQELQYVSCE